VAVTGSAGTGKSLVCRRFAQLGVPVIELDALSRQAVSPSGPALKKLAARFGEGVLNPDGTLNRKSLREKVIREDDARRFVESVLHPEIRRLLDARVSRINGNETPFVVVEIPLLFESGMEDAFDAVVLVMAERRLQIKRLSERDQVSETEAGLLLKTQIDDEKKIDRSDFVIVNTGTIGKLHIAVDRVFFALKKKYSPPAEIA
jgi:dephospho-CoA kinase